MPWLVIDADLRHHRKIAALPDHEARWAWVVTLMEGKRQKRPGCFASADHLRYILGDDLAPYVEHFVRLRLLEQRKTGALVIHDWADYQRDPTGAERQRRYRDRHRNVTSNEEVTPTRARPRPVALPVDVSPSSKGVGSGAGVGSDDPEWPAMVWLSEHRASLHEGSKLHLKLIRLSEKHGAQAVIRAMAALGDGLEANQYVLGADNELNPIPSRLSPAERRAAEKAAVLERIRAN